MTGEEREDVEPTTRPAGKPTGAYFARLRQGFGGLRSPSPEAMSPAERLEEAASLLARGFLRHRVRRADARSSAPNRPSGARAAAADRAAGNPEITQVRPSGGAGGKFLLHGLRGRWSGPGSPRSGRCPRT